jgi:hypothetical protein
MMRAAAFCAAMSALAWIATPSVAGEPFVATLRLDPFSIVSFGDQEIYQIPEGSEIQLEFPAAEGTGAMGFQVRPRGADVPPLLLRREDESLRFTLASTANGMMRRAEDGRLMIDLDAFLLVTLDHPDAPGSKSLPIRFTTETAQAKSLEGDRVIDVAGTRVAGSGVQLVGTATNEADDYPKPGAPVYVILSGAFDQLPVLH